MEITVIDDSDIVGWLASATREDEVYMHDVASMVDSVLTAVQERQPYRRFCAPGQQAARIDRLNIVDHGNDDGIEIGEDWIDSRTLLLYEPALRRLRGSFSQGGFVHFQHCNIGSNRNLMLALARAFDVDVYAGTGKHNPVYRFNLGSYVRARPSGSYTAGVGRP